MRSVNLLGVLLAVGLLAASLSGCGPGEARQEEPAFAPVAAAVETVRQVRVIEPRLDTLVAVRTAAATVEPVQEARVAAGTSGRVVAIPYRAGQRVEAGAELLVLEDTHAALQVRNAELAVESARINLQRAERANQDGLAQLSEQLRLAQANVALAEARYREGQALSAVGGIAATELLALEAQLVQARAALLQAEEALSRSQRAAQEDLALLAIQLRQAEAQLAQARTALRETRVRAPFAGEVAALFVEEGEFVAAGSPVVRLVGTERRQVRVSVPPEDAAVLLDLPVLYIRYAGLDYAAYVTYTSSAPGPQRLVDLTAELYPAERPIPFGGVGQLRYEVPLARGPIVPATALAAEAGQSVLYLVDGDRVRRQVVTVLAESGGEVVLDALPEGARVIFPRPPDLREGVRVEVVG